MTPDLFAHQYTGAEWLAERAKAIGGGYLADTMGLGKTRTLLAALHMIGAKRPVVICPAIVRTHWRREAALMNVELAAVMSYERAVTGGAALQRELNADAVVVDEAHYAKSMDALRTRRVFGAGGYARMASVVFAASGTPMPKNPAELWPVLSCFPKVCREHKLPSFREFKQRHCASVLLHLRGRNVERLLPKLRNETAFQAMLESFMLRRTDGVNTPPVDWQITPLDLGIADLESTEHAGTETSKWRHAIGDAKAEHAIHMLRDFLDGGDEKIVVFAHHRSVLQALRNGIYPVPHAYIDGDTRDRDEQIDRFQTDPQCRVFIGQNLACQTGITLTAARRVMIVEPDWTNDVNVQLGHRVARIGQLATHCIVQHIVAAGTLDEAIIRRNRAEHLMSQAAGFASE